MFGLIRLVLFSAAAFVAGALFERNDQRTACIELGIWQNGICIVKAPPDG